MSERYRCACGDLITERGRANHERGGHHVAVMSRQTHEARGLVALPSSTYDAWVENGPGAVSAPCGYDGGGRGRRGRGTTWAWYVPKAIAEIVLAENVSAKRRREFAQAWRAGDPRVEQALTAYAISGDANALLLRDL